MTKENLLLLKDLLEPSRIKFIKTSISINVYVDELGETVNKYNKTY